MKYFIYDILLHISLLVSLPYFVVKMFTARKYREGIRERFGFIAGEKLKGLADRGGPVVWVHAISVGETRAVLPVLKLLKERRPDARIVFSTVTITGNRCAARDAGSLIEALIYFPLDLSWTVKRALNAVRPDAVVVVEKEVWPNFIRTLRDKGVPLVVVNGTVSERSFKRFKSLGFIFREVFGAITFFSARTKEDLTRAVEAGVGRDRGAVAGDLKFDVRPPVDRGAGIEGLRSALRIAPGDKVIVAGSTHAGEEEIVLGAFRRLCEGFKEGGLRLVIAPRHPERFDSVAEMLKSSGLEWRRRTDPAPGRGLAPCRVVLLDTVGELMAAYSFATVAVVGGSLVRGIGGHNLLEPACHARPVVYGKHLTAYKAMAGLLEEAGGGFRVDGEAGLVDALAELLTNDVMRRRAGMAAQKVVERNTGASGRTVEIIERFMPRPKRGKGGGGRKGRK